MSTENKAPKATENKKPKSFREFLNAEEKVKVRIPVDNQNPKDLIVRVALNGVAYQIKRGESVGIPKSIAKILEEAKYI